MSLAYYNEHDEYAAEWLRNLIAAGHIAPGIVDSRDIRDIAPDELKGFTQCHFFAGVGVWSYALRSAGIPDSQPLWTGSCPCQPFSAAGKGGGFDDERHLWPAWHWLIEQCRPPIVLGEQVASKDGLGWYDLVSADLEGTGYAVGAVDLCAAGIGVEWQDSQGGEWLRRAIHDCTDPRIAMALSDFADWAGAGNIDDGGKHIRQRLYFVGLADSERFERFGRRTSETGDQSGAIERTERLFDAGGLADPMHAGRPALRAVAGSGQIAGSRAAGGMDDNDDARPQGHAGDDGAARREGPDGPIATSGVSGRMVDTDSSGTRAQPGDYREAGEETTRGTRPDDSTALSQRTGRISGLADSDGGQPRQTGSLQSGGQFGQQPQDSRSPDGPSRSDASDSRRDAVDWLFCRDDKWRAVAASIQPLANVPAAAMVRMCPDEQVALEKEITEYAETFSRDPHEDLLNLWQRLPTEKISEQIRGNDEFPTEEVLFAFLRQLASEGWSFADRISRSCSKIPSAGMRELWDHEAFAGTSRRRGLDEQRIIEPSNPLHFLSSILARYASTAWAETQRTYAEPSFPLSRNESARVGRLRGYGNALDAKTATRFCEVVKEICDA